MSHKRLSEIVINSVLFSVFLILVGCSSEATKKVDDSLVNKNSSIGTEVDERPNIVIVVADDLGLTDIGALGSEIATPNIDALANAGVKLSNFHTAATCSPTRSMLLSGTDNHLAGLGAMDEVMQTFAPYLLGKPGYEGHLNDSVATLPEVMADANYQTFMVGKWHLGKKEGQMPKARGFQRSFALMEGGAGHLDDRPILPSNKKSTYLEDDKPASLPQDFYSSPFFTSKMKQYLGERDKTKPFMSYMAYTAPHFPLQAPESSIAKYKGKYDEGYEALAQSRLERQKELGIIAQSTQLPPLPRNIKPWASLTAEEKKISAKQMEIYAAMVTDLDTAIGDLVTYLKDEGVYDNTIIFFMSDNGAEANTPNSPAYRSFLKEFVARCCDNSYENMGKANSYVMYGPQWARAGSGVKRLYKGATTQGGIHTPAFVHFPKMVKAKQYDGLVSVMDIMPTILELANAQHPYSATNEQNKFIPMRGASMLNMLTGKSANVHSADYALGAELHGNKAIRKGDWKLLSIGRPAGNGQWGLYNLADDPAELVDVSASYPEKFAELKLAWQEYAEEVGVQKMRPRKKN
ncbi:MAG: arylsulfatase [Paraglaciecola sp.]|uniref:arylsulfatase n=1 Tax=Paraglaciecola sp. TaxID=1920173 RepID=UPI003296ED1D